MALSDGHVIRISEIPGRRWDLALAAIAAAGPLTVLNCEPPGRLQRTGVWPGEDGHIHVSIFRTREPPTFTVESATLEVPVGLEHLALATAADPRLQARIEEYEFVRGYVFDYGHGAVRIGAISEDGTVTLLRSTPAPDATVPCAA